MGKRCSCIIAAVAAAAAGAAPAASRELGQLPLGSWALRTLAVGPASAGVSGGRFVRQCGSSTSYCPTCGSELFATGGPPEWTSDFHWRLVPALNGHAGAVSLEAAEFPGRFVAIVNHTGNWTDDDACPPLCPPPKRPYSTEPGRVGVWEPGERAAAGEGAVDPDDASFELIDALAPGAGARLSFRSLSRGQWGGALLAVTARRQGLCAHLYDNSATDVALVHGPPAENATFELRPLGGTPAPAPAAPASALNVLFMVADDLRPQLGSYGLPFMRTPHLDAFARSALVFDRAYVQYSFCCPTRNSFMTARRPSQTKVWNFKDHFREAGVGADWVTLPQWFKQRGYFTHGVGKVFHPGLPPQMDPPSWSDPFSYDQLPFVPGAANGTARRTAAAERVAAVAWAQKRPYNCSGGCKHCTWCVIPAESGAAGPDDALAATAKEALLLLAAQRNATGRPFFLGVGFHKPHVPWVTPERFQRLYDAADLPLPSAPLPPTGMPPMAWNKGLGAHALDAYTDTAAHPAHPQQPFPDGLTRELRRAYYASVSYVDWMAGEVLGALDASGLRDSTVVSFLGDHGYQLGEHNLWCKMTNFELGTRVPLIIRVPGTPGMGRRTAALAEALDLYRTLADAALGERVAGVDGASLMPVIRNASASVKQAAYSEFVKCYTCINCTDAVNCSRGYAPGDEAKNAACPTDWVVPNGCPNWRGECNASLGGGPPLCPGSRCDPDATAAPGGRYAEMSTCWGVPRELFDLVGYTVRTADWRYTEWLHWDGKALHGDWERPPVGRELYDHRHDQPHGGDWIDGFENENLADDPSLSGVVAAHHGLLVAGFPPRAEPQSV